MRSTRQRVGDWRGLTSASVLTRRYSRPRMSGVGFGLRWGHTRFADLIAIAPGAAYFVGVAAFFAGSRSALLIPLLLAPTPLFVYALLQRTPLTSTEKTTLWGCTALFTAL